jgi:hypothetical protein
VFFIQGDYLSACHKLFDQSSGRETSSLDQLFLYMFSPTACRPTNHKENTHIMADVRNGLLVTGSFLASLSNVYFYTVKLLFRNKVNLSLKSETLNPSFLCNSSEGFFRALH